MFYAKSTRGFYDPSISGDTMPDDVVEITPQLHVDLLNGQSQGKAIVPDENGMPVLADVIPVEQTYSEKRAAEYPDFKEYLDGVVKGDQAQIDKYIADCLAIKAKYPKPESA